MHQNMKVAYCTYVSILSRPSCNLRAVAKHKSTAISATAAFKTLGVLPNLIPLALSSPTSIWSYPTVMVANTFKFGPRNGKLVP